MALWGPPKGKLKNQETYDLKGAILSCMLHERRHRLVKRSLRDRQNHKGYERGALEEVTCHQVWEMDARSLKYGLQNPRKPSTLSLTALRELYPGIADDDMRVSSKAIVSNGTVSTGDFVFFFVNGRMQMGELIALVLIYTESHAMVNSWEAASQPGDDIAYKRFKRTEKCVQVLLQAIECPVLYAPSTTGQTCTAYIPLEYRGIVLSLTLA